MDFLSLIGVAISLSMDALAISLLNGCLIKQLKVTHAIRIAFSFGFFQAIMPVLGWFSGSIFHSYVAHYKHWVVFGILLLVGCKMIYEAVSPRFDTPPQSCLHFKTLLALSIATSIDAFAVGISFAFLYDAILVPVVIIGVVTFLICFAGIYLGKQVGRFFDKGLELTGGIVIICLGVYILLKSIL